MSYLVYARKYRPVVFEEVIGQKHVVQTLQNAIKTNRLAQGYLFFGMRGVGKTTIARLLAKALNCLSFDGPTPTPCNTCDACIQINEDRAVDVLEIDGASHGLVDDVRVINEGVKYRPIHFRFKVIIIDEVHMLGKSAFNALLKTLEEPPPHTIFIFATTEFHKVPATIVSRCQHFEFKKITHGELVKHLRVVTKNEGITLSEAGLNLIADAAEGSVRDSQSLLDQAVSFAGEHIGDDDLRAILGTVRQELLFKASRAVFAEKQDEIFAVVEEILEKGHDLRYFYGELIQHFRRLLIVKTTSRPEEILPLTKDEIGAYAEDVANIGGEDLLRFLNALQQAEQGLRYTSHPRIYLETTLVKLSYFKRIVPIAEILAHMKDLSPGAPSAAMAPPRKKIEENEPLPSGYERPAQEKRETSPPKHKISERAGGSGSEDVVKKAEGKNPPRREREVDKALNDPDVQDFMDTFKAQILSAETIDKDKKS
ncbi:MAG: DNA polymerase III subunit gamma/tau [Acidobacteria bacterium]|nr:DNA polymerase III subunit gamma/tau [Acidobacteriota bacterium]MBU4329527.1 DNA polymerase III subunit gamma/tau [Acidobacteriota bacterium]MBU4495144.1 DNA polymerase III subunit gamma/tau [Acidobacteriota bacterium]MCG2817311.1 DNA polymerase III subunit gamma/tau [Candidatus Aminicenantes bacterium]